MSWGGHTVVNKKIILGAVVCTYLLPGQAISAGKQDSTMTVEKVLACIPMPNDVQTIMSKLQWQPSTTGLCGGEYKKSAISYVEGFQLSADDLNLAFQGQSTVKGNVIVKHENKMLSAELAHIYRYQDKIKRLELLGNVVFEEPERRLIASKADFNVETYAGSLDEVLYRISINKQDESQRSLTAWGQSCLVERDTKANLTLHQVSYSTCPAGAKLWHLKAKKLTLLKKESKGVMQDAKLYFKNTPIFYVPYLSFPLDNKRKSGFLGSQLTFTSQNGIGYELPYYLDLAPNMDATLYPEYLTQRGLMMGGEYRYLFEKSSGIMQAHFIASDKEFQTFKSSNLWQAPQLASLSDNRYSLKWMHNSQLTSNLDLHIDVATVSDDYYLQDFNHDLSMANTNQLLRQARANYHTKHWQYHLLVQDYQTLHPFNQSTIQGVYSLMPSFIANGDYDFAPQGLHLSLPGQWDNFIWHGDATSNKPEGSRFYAGPSLNWMHLFRGGYLNPALALSARYYELSQYNGAKKQFSQVLPMSSIDMGLSFEKPLIHGWQQTLEPRLFYLYVPYANQYAIPMFDSGNMFPSFEQLFRTNRFAGFDRIGDANHLSFGLKSRFVDPDGIDQLTLSVGSIYKFQSEKVFACQSFQDVPCSDSINRVGYVSPDAGLGPTQFQIEARLYTHVDLLGNLAFDTRSKKVNNAMVNFHFEPQPNHLINAGYGFVLNGDPTQIANVNQTDINLHQFRLSYAWPYNDHWRSLGAWSYNLSHGFSSSYFVGLQYDTCCMAFRLLGGRTYRYFNSAGGPTFGNNFYLQVLLKGLGSAANSDPVGLIHQYLPTFRDSF